MGITLWSFENNQIDYFSYFWWLSWPFFWVVHCDDLGLLQPEAATVGCCRRQQHLWSHRNPYSRPEAVIFSCCRRPRDFLSHMSRQKSGLWSLYVCGIRSFISHHLTTKPSSPEASSVGTIEMLPLGYRQNMIDLRMIHTDKSS